MFRTFRWVPVALMASALTGCNDINTGQDQRSGRGNGDQMPTTGPASQGTNATATDVTLDGPGTPKIIENKEAPGVSTPYGGDGKGAAPPVSPAQGEKLSGDSNGGRETGKQGNVGSDSTTNNASSRSNLGGAGSGQPPK